MNSRIFLLEIFVYPVNYIFYIVFGHACTGPKASATVPHIATGADQVQARRPFNLLIDDVAADLKADFSLDLDVAAENIALTCGNRDELIGLRARGGSGFDVRSGREAGGSVSRVLADDLLKHDYSISQNLLVMSNFVGTTTVRRCEQAAAGAIECQSIVRTGTNRPRFFQG